MEKSRINQGIVGMSDKANIFNKINESLDEIMSGRRFLISAIEKLRKSLPDLGPKVDELGIGIEKISALANVSGDLTQVAVDLKDGLQSVSGLASLFQTVKGELQDLTNNVSQMKPVLDSIRGYLQRQENGLLGISQALQAVMEQLGQVLAKVG